MVLHSTAPPCRYAPLVGRCTRAFGWKQNFEASCAQRRPQASSGFFGLLRAWIARGAVWCPPQARHGLSITHLSAGCQGFEALSKASAAANNVQRPSGKCLHRYTQGQPHAKRSGTARRRGSSASTSDSLQPPPPHEWIPTPQFADHRHRLRCQWHIRCCRNNAAREKFWHVLMPLGRAMRSQRKITARCAHNYGERVEV